MNPEGLPKSLHVRLRAYSLATGTPMYSCVDDPLGEHFKEKCIAQVTERILKAPVGNRRR